METHLSQAEPSNGQRLIRLSADHYMLLNSSKPEEPSVILVLPISYLLEEQIE